MTEPLFHVIAEGRPAVGFDATAVARQLAEQLKLAPAQAQRLLAGRPIIAKRAVAHTIAEKYCVKLTALGLAVHIEAVAETNSAADNGALPSATAASSIAAPTPATAASSTQADWPALSDFFAGIVIPASCTHNSVRYLRRIVAASTQTLWIALAYGGIALSAVAVFAFYCWYFGYLLSAPPILFSISVFIVPWLLLLLGTAILLRPFYPQPHVPSAAVALHPHSQPQLFHWLAQLCERIAVPMPEEVAIGTQVIDQVTPFHGAQAFWQGHYRLTLSLPALDINTLCISTAMLAATLGTQAKTSALRSRRLLDSVSSRFDTCLENNDWLSAKILQAERSLSAKNSSAAQKLSPLFRLLHKSIALHNRLLARFSQRLMHARRKLARHALLEADRLQALLVGADNFSENVLRQHKLAQAYRDADNLNRADRGGNLVADLPALIRFYFDNFDPKTKQLLQAQWRETTAPNREVLPTAGERIEAARHCATSAVLTSTLPASTLLHKHATLAQQVTQTFYDELDLPFDAAQLSAADEVIFTATEDMLRRQQATLYFNNWFKPFRFWRVADYALIRDMPTGDAAQQLNVCINEIRRLTPDRMRLLNEYERLQNQIQELLLGQLVLTQGRNFQFRYVIYDGTNLQPLLEERQQQMLKVTEQLATQETIMGGRITLGLRLSGQAPSDIESLHKALHLGVGLEHRLYKLALDTFQLEQLLQRHTRREADYGLPIKRLEEKINDASLLLLERLKEIPYPLDPRYATLSAYVTTLLEKPQNQSSKSATLDRAQRLLNTLYGFNEALTRLAADCGTIAEEAYNIEPIKLIG